MEWVKKIPCSHLSNVRKLPVQLLKGIFQCLNICWKLFCNNMNLESWISFQDDSDNDAWDDTALIKAYDSAVTKMKVCFSWLAFLSCSLLIALLSLPNPTPLFLSSLMSSLAPVAQGSEVCLGVGRLSFQSSFLTSRRALEEQC